MASLNLDFIKKAERVTSFNIRTSDFQTLDYKKELQHLFNKHFFPNFDVSKTIKTVDQNQLNKLILELKRDSDMFPKLHNYNLKGVGPGEATLFFLINTAYLGGGSSAGVDLISGSKNYEIKAATISPTRIASNFKLGGTVPLASIMTDINSLRESLKLGGTKTEISGTIIKMMKSKSPDKFALIEHNYATVAYEYFKLHEVIFINNTSGSNLGKIEAIKKVSKDDILIERVTSGTVKPRIIL
jgi:hypothetical protein